MGRRSRGVRSDTSVGDLWAFGQPFRSVPQRTRKPIAIGVLLALMVGLTGPVALAEDQPPADPPPAETTESAADPSPSAEPSPSPSAEPEPADDATTAPPVDPSPSPSDAPSTPAASPTIASDKDDYPPGGFVVLTGSNWQPGETVHIRVNDDAGETWRRDVDVVADAAGDIRDEFTLPNWFVATYSVTATGTSGSVTATFTDSNPQSITVTPASATVIQGSTAVYSVSLQVGGNDDPCDVTFSVTGLPPAGTSVSFGTNPVSTTGDDVTTSLNITTTTSTPTGSFPFSVNGTNGAGCQGPGPTSGTATLVVNAANAAPVVDLNGPSAGIDYTTTFTEDGGAVAAVDSGALTVTDDGATIASATVTLTNRADGSAETLSVTGGSCAGITVTAYNGATGVLALSGNATKAAYQTCLRTLTYNNTDQDPDTNPRSVTVNVNDGSLDSALATSTIQITTVNDAPTLDLNGAGGGVDAAASYTENGVPTSLAPGAIVTDVDDVNLIAASVQLTIDPPSGMVVPDLPDEVLSWDSSPGGDCDALTVTYNDSTGTLIINGVATVGRYQACLRSIAYENSRDAMDVRNRNAEFTVFDGHALNSTSNRPDVTVTLVPVNDAPVATDGFESMDEDGAAITIDLSLLVSDAETADAFFTYTIVSDPAASAGTLTGLGTIGTYSFDSADNFHGTATFTYKVTDRGDPDACSPVSTSCSDVLDSATKTVTITVNAVNDAPVCQDVSITTDEDTPGETDPDCEDVDGDTLTYTVSPATNGTSGFAAGKITYDPDLNFNGPDSFTYTADDGNGGSDTANVAVTVNAVNDAPVIDEAGTKFANATVTCGASNAQLTVKFGDVDLADEAGDTHEVTVVWGDGSANTVVSDAESTETLSHTYASPGAYIATITVDDAAGASDSMTRGIVVNFNVVGDGFKQPVNNTRNGQPTSIFRFGSTIPLKLEVTDCAGNHPSGLEIRVYWQKIYGGTPIGESEAVATNQPDAGNLMRMADSHYMFNWNTKLATDSTSTVRIEARINLGGGMYQVVYSDIGLRK